jgi:hypothetical protein
MAKKPERKLTGVTRYTIEVKHYDDHSIDVVRLNQGINSMALLGLLEVAKRDVYDTMTRHIPPAQRYAGRPVAQMKSSIPKK